MDLVDTIPDVRYWSQILRCSIPTPHILTDLEVKVTDLEFFMINGMSISHISQSLESIHLSNIRTLESLLPFHNYWPQGTCHGVGLEVKNIEHPHALAILSSFFWHFLLARHSAGELRCSGTAFNYHTFRRGTSFKYCAKWSILRSSVLWGKGSCALVKYNHFLVYLLAFPW